MVREWTKSLIPLQDEEMSFKSKMDTASAVARRFLLGRAQHFAQRNEIYRATDLYLKLMREQARTQEAREAREAVLRIAKNYEAEGKRYHALSLYNKLEALPAEEPVDVEERVPVWIKEAIRTVVNSYAEEVWRAVLGERATRIAENQGATDEVPFVDLREEVNMKSNFERLGRVHRGRMDVARIVSSLKKLKGASPGFTRNGGQDGKR